MNEKIDSHDSEQADQVLLAGVPIEEANRLGQVLEAQNYRVKWANSLDSAFNLGKSELFDMIILDCPSLNLSPFEGYAAVHGNSSFRHSSILLIHESLESVHGITEEQNLNFLPRPFQLPDLLMKVRTQLRVRKIKASKASFDATLASRNAQLRELTARFKQDLKEAQAIQQGILPRALPRSEKCCFAVEYLPLEAVGGDLYDVWQIDETRYGLFIADVSGHGLPAAFISAMTKMALAYAPKDSPAEMLAEMNDGLSPLLCEGRFVTAAAAIINQETGELAVARAGHPHGLIWRARTKALERVAPRGIPLGVSPGMRYERFQTTLASGDRFFLFTDGLSEAQDMDGKMLGMDGIEELCSRIAETVEPDEALVRLIQYQQEFRDGRIVKDDVTILMLELLGSA